MDGKSSAPAAAVAGEPHKVGDAVEDLVQEHTPYYPTGMTLKALVYLFAGATAFGIFHANTPKIFKIFAKIACGSSGFITGSRWARQYLPTRVEDAAETLDSIKRDRWRKLAISVVVDGLIAAILFKKLEFVEVALGEDGWDGAHTFLLNVLYGPIINAPKVLGGALPFLAPFIPCCLFGWALENGIISEERVDSLLGGKDSKRRKAMEVMEDVNENPIKGIVKFVLGYAKGAVKKKKAVKKQQ